MYVFTDFHIPCQLFHFTSTIKYALAIVNPHTDLPLVLLHYFYRLKGQKHWNQELCLIPQKNF